LICEKEIEKIVQIDTHNEKLRAEFKEVQYKIESYNHENHALQKKCDDYTARIRAYENECNIEKKYEIEYHDLQAKLHELNEKLVMLRTQEKTVQHGNELVYEQEEQHKVIEEDLGPLQNEIQLLKEENERLERSLRDKEARTGDAVKTSHSHVVSHVQPTHSHVVSSHVPTHSHVVSGSRVVGGHSHVVGGMSHLVSGHSYAQPGRVVTGSHHGGSRVVSGGSHVVSGRTHVQGGTHVVKR
jgi:chromosome segregation ATPase